MKKMYIRSCVILLFAILIWLPQPKVAITSTPDYLGLDPEAGLWKASRFGEDVIIGFFESGIWPEHHCFDDHGMKPVGARWKGFCQSAKNFNKTHCNNKVIGAKVFVSGDSEPPSPRDYHGHGTSVASVAACNEVQSVEFNGTATGLTPKARIALYKVTDLNTKYGINRGPVFPYDDAILDGVDVFSVSNSMPGGLDHYQHPLSIGSFAAIQKGIPVVASAGNEGPDPYTVTNSAPWVITVGASTTGPTFPTQLVLGDGTTFTGSTYEFLGRPMVRGRLILVDQCSLASSPNKVVDAKILVCKEPVAWGKALQFRDAGALGIVEIDSDRGWLRPKQTTTKINKEFPIPGLTVGYEEGLKILAYLNQTEKPFAEIKFEKDTALHRERAPMVATYSSIGPSLQTPAVLKPDILAPGTEILTAASGYRGARQAYMVVSGTSFAAPVIAGIVALLRVTHPTWSPAAIKSALMTTAQNFDNQIASEADMRPVNPFHFGAGLVNPEAAYDPGLVYDADVDDYIQLLCSLDYTEEQINMITRGNPNVSCADYAGPGPGDFNYPSFSFVYDSQHQHRTKTHTRTLTNVTYLHEPETYRARVVNPASDAYNITVTPQELTFSELNEKKSFTVTSETRPHSRHMKHHLSAYIIWESANHSVSSPIVMINNAYSKTGVSGFQNKILRQSTKFAAFVGAACNVSSSVHP